MPQGCQPTQGSVANVNKTPKPEQNSQPLKSGRHQDLITELPPTPQLPGGTLICRLSLSPKAQQRII